MKQNNYVNHASDNNFEEVKIVKGKIRDLRDILRKEKKKRRRRIVTFIILTVFLLYRLVFSMILIASNITVTAHRGGTKVAPENTIASILEAVALGADCVEIDVQMTKDGEVILLHDASFQRVAKISKRPRELMYEEVQELNVGAYKGETIEFHAPTLDEVIEVCQLSGMKLNIELKDYSGNDKLPYEVVKIIIEHDFVSNCVISSFSPKFLRIVKELCPEIKVGLITNSNYVTTYMKNNFVDFYSVSYYSLSPSIVMYAHARNKTVSCWTPNSQFAIQTAIRTGSDNIITDNVTLTQVMIVSMQ